jgi:glycosyltransferase involved in cell wall biosynthesis
LLDALDGTQLRIHLIGNGRLRDDLLCVAKKIQLELSITPRVEHHLLPLHINRSKIYVNLAAWEGHPKAMVEAMACGCVCIGAKSPGIKNLILDGETGLLVEPEPQRIRSAIEALLRNKELAERLAKNARDYAVEHFSLDKVFIQYKNLFEAISTENI